MAARQGDQMDRNPGTNAHAPAMKRKGMDHRKPTHKLPTVRKEAEPEADATEPIREDIDALGTLPELAEWQTEGGPSQAEFCKAQRECPTLVGLW